MGHDKDSAHATPRSPSSAKRVVKRCSRTGASGGAVPWLLDGRNVTKLDVLRAVSETLRRSRIGT